MCQDTDQVVAVDDVDVDVSTSGRHSPRIGHGDLTSGEWPKRSLQRTKDSMC
jgi:hypothetical protein